ncbi:MAG: flagellar hook-length control protein FliK, partial [Ignavibacteria bacterium]|nr:flagellar hook-length control protein FliK [Ignavibacteria bacterium]
GTLKSGDAKSLENVEISLIANGQSIKNNPLTTSIVELENWANEQLQLNSDFEILVKSGQQKLSVDVEPVKKEISKTDNPVEIISISTDDDIEAGTKSIVDKNTTELTPVLKNTAGLESASKQPLEGLKQTIAPVDDQTVKQEIPAEQKQGNPYLKIDPKIMFDKNIVNDKSEIIEPKVHGKVVGQNIPIAKSDLTKEFIPGTKNELFSDTETLLKKENVLTDLNSLSQKIVSAEKQVDASIKIISNESKVKHNVLRSDETLNNIEMVKKTSEVNVKETNKSDLKITVKVNQKINSVSINKNVSQDKIVLNDLINKTDVKEIDINVQKIVKANTTNTPIIQNEKQPDIVSFKENTFKIQSPVVNTEVKKGISTNQEIKQPIVKKYLEAEHVKTEKTISNNAEEKPTITKPELNAKFADTVKAQSTNNFKGLQELSAENKNLEQIKTSPDVSLKLKADINASETSKKILTPQIKIEQKSVNVKTSPQLIKNETVKVQNSNAAKEVVNENVKEAIKEVVNLKTNTDTINKESEKTEINSSNSSKVVSKNLTGRSAVENLRTSLKENLDSEAKPESITKNQFENKSVKVDLMQRRVYSQIPPLEVISEENEIKILKNPLQNTDANKNENIRTLDNSVKSASHAAESKPNNEKQVWVKVSLEKPDVENVSEVKKQAPQQSKITIDTNNDSMKKDSGQNNYSEKESHESKNIKPQNISVETTKNTEQKPVVQNQTTNNQQDLVTNIRPEIKSEHNPFKSVIHSEETRFSSRAAEVVEKIKVISSGELVREVYKVFESGEKQSIVLSLVPKELVSIKIILDTIDNVLTAKVEVENESVGHIIRNNVDQLKQSLLQSGVHVNSINISYHNPDQKQNGFYNNKRKNPSYLPNNDVEEVDESILSKKMGYNTYEYLA